MDSKKIALGIVALGIITLAGFMFINNKKNKTTSPESQNQTAIQKQTAQESSTQQTAQQDQINQADVTIIKSEYKDGIYTAIGTYEAPPGEEKIGVTVTLKDGLITNSSLEKLGKAETSKKMQANFESGYKVLVTGKDIDSIDLGVVAGSSLTPNGFENALDQIKKKAQS